MDDLFSYPSDHVHGGTPPIKPTRRRSKTASSFRAVWDPVAVSPFGNVPDVYRRGPGGAPAHARASAEVAQVAVMPAPPALDFGEIVQPVVGVATAVRQRVQARPAVKRVRETAWERIATRGLEMLPLALAGALITSLVWGAYFLPIPLVIMLLGFDFYWAWRSINMGIHTLKGYRALKATAHVDWRRRFDLERSGLDGNVVEWDDVHHLIIIPTYKESVDKLRATLGKLAESEVALEKLLVVVAMEAADAGRAGALRDPPARVRAQLPRDDRHAAPRRHPGRSARQVVERGVGRARGEAVVLRRDGLRTGPHDGHQLRRRHALPPSLLQRPHVLLRRQPAPLSARSGRVRSSTTTTSGTSPRRCASRTAWAASTISPSSCASTPCCSRSRPTA